MSRERWDDYPLNPEYLVSDRGRVVGYKGKLMKPYDGGNGYLKVGPWGEQLKVHRMVCWTFHGPPPTPEHHAAHWDGDKSNNRADNLRWATAVENMADSIRQGKAGCGRGELNANARLIAEDVREVRALRRAGWSSSEVAECFGITPRHVNDLASGRRWGHVSDDPAA